MLKALTRCSDLSFLADELAHSQPLKLLALLDQGRELCLEYRLLNGLGATFSMPSGELIRLPTLRVTPVKKPQVRSQIPSSHAYARPWDKSTSGTSAFSCIKHVDQVG